jgi:hypothetical protein
MIPKFMVAFSMLWMACGAPCQAQSATKTAAPVAAPTATPAATPVATPFPTPTATAAPADRGEPSVNRTVIEDDGARIDELRVRGQTQRVSVTPKVGPRKRYEIITGDAGRDPFEGTGGARSAVGKRVWNVLDF